MSDCTHHTKYSISLRRFCALVILIVGMATAAGEAMERKASRQIDIPAASTSIATQLSRQLCLQAGGCQADIEIRLTTVLKETASAALNSHKQANSGFIGWGSKLSHRHVTLLHLLPPLQNRIAGLAMNEPAFTLTHNALEALVVSAINETTGQSTPHPDAFRTGVLYVLVMFGIVLTLTLCIMPAMLTVLLCKRVPESHEIKRIA